MLIYNCEYNYWEGDYCSFFIDYLKKYKIKTGFGDYQTTMKVFSKSNPNEWQQFKDCIRDDTYFMRGNKGFIKRINIDMDSYTNYVDFRQYILKTIDVECFKSDKSIETVIDLLNDISEITIIEFEFPDEITKYITNYVERSQYISINIDPSTTVYTIEKYRSQFYLKLNNIFVKIRQYFQTNPTLLFDYMKSIENKFNKQLDDIKKLLKLKTKKKDKLTFGHLIVPEYSKKILNPIILEWDGNFKVVLFETENCYFLFQYQTS